MATTRAISGLRSTTSRCSRSPHGLPIRRSATCAYSIHRKMVAVVSGANEATLMSRIQPHAVVASAPGEGRMKKAITTPVTATPNTEYVASRENRTASRSCRAPGSLPAFACAAQGPPGWRGRGFPPQMAANVTAAIRGDHQPQWSRGPYGRREHTRRSPPAEDPCERVVDHSGNAREGGAREERRSAAAIRFRLLTHRAVATRGQ